jgi:hypothetical protein
MAYRANNTHSKPMDGIIGGKLNVPTRSMLEKKANVINPEVYATL